tara:strand:+ start:1219 stop:1413 length:195 start_codon:yes stop_codon:yes gene_type:complete
MEKKIYRFSDWIAYVKKKELTMYNIPNNFSELALYYFDYYNNHLDYETNYINYMNHEGYYIYKK